MALFETSTEEPNSKRLRYAVSGVALVILVTFGIWFFFLRFISEKHTVEHFMDAVVAQDYQRAFQIWKSHGSYTYQDFMADWALDGYYGPIKSYRIESASLPPNGGSGVVVVVDPPVGGEKRSVAQLSFMKIGAREILVWPRRGS